MISVKNIVLKIAPIQSPSVTGKNGNIYSAIIIELRPIIPIAATILNVPKIDIHNILSINLLRVIKDRLSLLKKFMLFVYLQLIHSA